MLFAQKAGLYTCKHIYNKYVYANRSVCIHGDIATLFLVILSTEQGSLYTWRYLHSTYVYAICPTHVHYGCLFNLPNGQACIHADICTACHFMISASKTGMYTCWGVCTMYVMPPAKQEGLYTSWPIYIMCVSPICLTGRSVYMLIYVSNLLCYLTIRYVYMLTHVCSCWNMYAQADTCTPCLWFV